MKKDKIIPELYETDEPEMEQKPTEEEVKAELKRIEAEEEAEDEAFDKLELNDGEEAMTEEELAQFSKTTKQAEKDKKNHSAPIRKEIKEGFVKQAVKKVTKEVNVINADKCMLYYYPTPKEWEQIHKLKPARIIFYFTMTKHEYKELFLCQVKYQTKIIGSTGARVI